MLKSVVTDLASVDDSLRAFYVERDGKHVLNVEPVDGLALEDVGGLKSALSAERRAHADAVDGLREAKSRLDAFGDLDPQAARDALQRLAEGPADVETIVKARIDGMRAGIVEAVGADARTARAELDTLKGTLTKREAQLQKLALDNVLQSELSKVKPLDDAADALLLMAAQHVRMVEEDGELVARVVDRKGEPRLDAKGQPFTIAAFMAEMRDSRPSLFRSSTSIAGLGTNPQDKSTGRGGGAAPNPWSPATRNLTQQAMLIKSNPALASRLMAEAGA